MRRLLATKAVLWFAVGGAAALALVRLVRGLGATTALTDLTPWGFWIGFDVMGGVALAAGGFVVAATVYVFRLERYHDVVRPAVLTAFLGYVAVVVGLLLDLGLPWNIWHMILYWNPRSPLFEVGWCVMLYTTVLALELAPVVLELAKHPLLARLHGALVKVRVPLVVLGIMLSTLHQSSLGSLFLIMPHRLHPLWYTPILPILFFVSAVALGLLMVTAESIVSAYLYDREPEWEVVRGLGRAGAWVLAGYGALKVVDVLARGQAASVLAGTFESWLWIFELLLSTVVPGVLLASPALRSTRGGIAAAAFTGVAGFVMNRVDVGGLAQVGTTGTRYVPSWTEVWMSGGVVAGAALVYFAVAERFHLFHAGPVDRDRFKNERPRFDPATLVASPDAYSSGLARYTLLGAVGAAVAVALLPGPVLAGARGIASPVQPAGLADRIVLDGARPSEASVLFDHKAHVGREGGDASCARCHHLVFSGERGTGCGRCHRDLYQPTSIFDHRAHEARLGPGAGCGRCHGHEAAASTRPCLECHVRMVPAAATLRPRHAPALGRAPGYAPALHGLCIGCHAERAKDARLNKPTLGDCRTCHAGKVPAFDPLRPGDRQVL